MPSPGPYDGQITCSRERTDHVLSTRSRGLRLNGGRRPGTLPSLMTPGCPPGALKGALMDFVLAPLAVISALLAAWGKVAYDRNAEPRPPIREDKGIGSARG